MITAHGGALKTGRNTHKYFQTMTNYNMDAIEVDIWKKGDKLYLAHAMPKLSLKRAILLDYVFEYCKKHKVKVNCDLKQSDLVAPVLALAKKLDALEYVIFTGTVLARNIPQLTHGETYLNGVFYKDKYKLCTENLPDIKAYIDSFDNKNIAGINIPYKYATNDFVAKAKEIGLGLSIYTVDNVAELTRLISFEPANITTNLIDIALDIREKHKKGR